MSKSLNPYLRHILDEIEFLSEKATNLKKEAFLNDEVLRRAFVRSLEIIGEAVKNLPAEIKTENSEINWKAIAGTRDILIHGYFGVDYEIVWDIIITELPPLKKTIEKILK